MTEFNNDWKSIDEIDGWLSRNEANMLYQLAGISPGTIVEIGSWKGRSSATLAMGSKNNPLHPPVLCIDPFTGSKEHRDIDPECNTWNDFWTNLTNLKLFDIIQPIQKSSREAYSLHSGDIGMLFIDGSHEFEDVEFDFLNWGSKVVSGGYICLHDCSWPGPAEVIMKYLFHDRYMFAPQFIGSLLNIRVR